MTDDKGAGEGPYKMKDHLKFGDNDFIVLGNVQEILIANLAYAEGRKAGEKDFKELLEIAQSLDNDTGYVTAATQTFTAWKKARGIE